MPRDRLPELLASGRHGSGFDPSSDGRNDELVEIEVSADNYAPPLYSNPSQTRNRRPVPHPPLNTVDSIASCSPGSPMSPIPHGTATDTVIQVDHEGEEESKEQLGVHVPRSSFELPPEPTYVLPPTSPLTSPDAILTESENLASELEAIEKLIRDILRPLQNRVLGEVSVTVTAKMLDEVEELAERIDERIRVVRKRVSGMKNATTVKSRMRKAVQVAVARKLSKVVVEYREIREGFRKQIEKQAERQYRIARPSASAKEVASAISSAGSKIGHAVFSQLILSTPMGDQQRRVLREVQIRQNDLAKIERSIEELVRTFEEMRDLIDAQEEDIKSIVEDAEETEVALREADQEMQKAVEYRRNTRMWAWVLCSAVGLLVIVVGLVVLFQVILPMLNTTAKVGQSLSVN